MIACNVGFAEYWCTWDFEGWGPFAERFYVSRKSWQETAYQELHWELLVDLHRYYASQ